MSLESYRIPPVSLVLVACAATNAEPNGSNPMHIYLAALQAGFYYVPINYRLSAPEIAYILQDADRTSAVKDCWCKCSSARTCA